MRKQLQLFWRNIGYKKSTNGNLYSQRIVYFCVLAHVWSNLCIICVKYNLNCPIFVRDSFCILSSSQLFKSTHFTKHFYWSICVAKLSPSPFVSFGLFVFSVCFLLISLYSCISTYNCYVTLVYLFMCVVFCCHLLGEGLKCQAKLCVQ